MAAPHAIIELVERFDRNVESYRSGQYPSNIQVEITTNCNLECKMCPRKQLRNQRSNPSSHIDEIIWEKILETAKKLNHVAICGFGEPTCNPNFVRYLQDLNNREIGISFSTNGVKLDSSTAEIIGSIKNISNINISIDSSNPNIYRKIRGTELNCALRGVKALLRSIQDPDKISVSSVVMRTNFRSLENHPTLLSSLGIRRLVLQNQIDINQDIIENRNKDIDRIDLQKTINNIRRNCSKLDIHLELTPMLEEDIKEDCGGEWCPNHNTRQCYLPWDMPFINKDGYVFPCCFADEANLMGNLTDNSFLEIWMGEKFYEFRSSLLSGDNMPAICRNCRAVQIGPHPFRIYSAQIIQDKSEFCGNLRSIIGALRNEGMRLKLVVKNEGDEAWTTKDPVLIGTSGRKDRGSAYYHPSWISGNRICTFTEKQVPAGDVAIFNFTILPNLITSPEVFQLVVDGVCWVPFSQFTITAMDFSKYNFLSGIINRLYNKYITDYLYRAVILKGEPVFEDESTMTLFVKNIGKLPWTRDTRLRIGIRGDKHLKSVYYHPSWIGEDRVCSFKEPTVLPKEIATFEFLIAPQSTKPIGIFQLVVEEVCWIPNTQF